MIFAHIEFYTYINQHVILRDRGVIYLDAKTFDFSSRFCVVWILCQFSRLKNVQKRPLKSFKIFNACKILQYFLLVIDKVLVYYKHKIVKRNKNTKWKYRKKPDRSFFMM